MTGHAGAPMFSSRGAPGELAVLAARSRLSRRWLSANPDFTGRRVEWRPHGPTRRGRDVVIGAWRSPWRLALVGVLLAAAYLRLAHIDLAELRREEAWNLLAAADLVAGRRLPLTGMGTSVAGLENGPALVYLLALPLLVARDAALASAFVALTNVAALGVAALLARRVFGWPAALFGAAAYAVGSWAVYFSRKIWPNDPMPLFSALLALGLYLAVSGGQARGLLLAGLSLRLPLNLHPSSLALGPFVGLALRLPPAMLRGGAA